MDDVRGDEADITINSKTVKLSLKLNEEKKADIDDDNLNDIKIRLERISEGEVTLRLTKLAENQGAKGITGFFIFNEKAKGYGAGILGLLFILVFAFKMFRRKKRG